MQWRMVQKRYAMLGVWHLLMKYEQIHAKFVLVNILSLLMLILPHPNMYDGVHIIISMQIVMLLREQCLSRKLLKPFRCCHYEDSVFSVWNILFPGQNSVTLYLTFLWLCCPPFHKNIILWSRRYQFFQLLYFLVSALFDSEAVPVSRYEISPVLRYSLLCVHTYMGEISHLLVVL